MACPVNDSLKTSLNDSHQCDQRIQKHINVSQTQVEQHAAKKHNPCANNKFIDTKKHSIHRTYVLKAQ